MLGNSANFMIDRQAQAYRSDLHSWTMRVKNARHFADALRVAQHPPLPGQMIRALSFATSSSKTKAMRDVEQDLSRKLKEADLETAHIPDLLRMTQGRWPGLWKQINDLLRIQKQQKQDP